MSLAEAQAIASAKALKEAKDEKDAVAAAARLAIKSDPMKAAPQKSKPASSPVSQNGMATNFAIIFCWFIDLNLLLANIFV